MVLQNIFGLLEVFCGSNNFLRTSYIFLDLTNPSTVIFEKTLRFEIFFWDLQNIFGLSLFGFRSIQKGIGCPL